jgi:hypothetical protein
MSRANGLPSTPYTKIDPNIRGLVRAINAFPDTFTIGCCGGHEKPIPGQWAAGEFFVKFVCVGTTAGLLSLEFLAWVINEDWRLAKYSVNLRPHAYPPYLNRPGKMLTFALEGADLDPDALAKEMNRVRRKYYIHADELPALYDEIALAEAASAAERAATKRTSKTRNG